ncbi:HAD-IA family hydrolase [Cupriavidus taiwanensis]|uniref:HAD-IA family hydrolase n=1 Tax=Cupriavidus taiwanensis TaxID=164546 RepID=UPI000E16FF76|nr:HAD-IA family hydrolase [Cupriavidus taiwanensis]SPA53074.1 conserved hypothetical protein [Cupriavidus taiwanensis]
MKILFYVNPSVVRSDPFFYIGAIEKKLAPQAKLLLAAGHEIDFVVSEFNASYVRNLIPRAQVHAVSQRELSAVVGCVGNLERRLYLKSDTEVARQLQNLLAEKIEGLSEVDAIIAWETPANFLGNLCPNAVMVHEMPGFLSRVPFPELYTLEAGGLFNESILVRHADDIRQAPVDPRGKDLLEGIRAELLTFVASNSPYARIDLDPLGQFNRLLLLPLQVTDQYAFLADSGYESQMELLLDVLQRVPADIGLVVTQYATASSSEKVLDKRRYRQLKESYPNLIYDEAFDAVDNISQYLLSSVDAVVTVSSSIGLQALLWQKPLITMGNSHLRCLSTYQSLQEYADAVETASDHAPNEDAILAWTLSYQQPLGGVVLDDASFLERWLSAMLEAAGDYKALPNFFDIIPDYGSQFIHRSKRERAGELLARTTTRRHTSLLEDEFKKVVQEMCPKVISFDIFDTLVDRSVEQPVHVFRLIEAEVDLLTEGRISNFASARQAIERRLRERIAVLGEQQEITLEEIYDEIGAHYALAAEMRDAIRDLEVREELRVLRRREAGWRLFEVARRSQAKILIISDMYLPESTIRQILSNAGYPQNIRVYVSSAIGLRKHEGDLFNFVRDAERIEFGSWLHVGDNPHGDIEVPSKLGIRTHLIQSAFRLIASNKKLNPILRADRKIRGKGEAAIYGLIQRRYFDDPFRRMPADTHFGGDAFALGYIGMGPVFFGFLHWVMTQAKKDGIEKLLFLSRDGKVLWRMAQVLFPESEGWPAIAYAMSSRRAARVSSLYAPGDISKLVDSSLSAVELGSIFEKKFGIELTDADEPIVREAGFAGRHAQVDSSKREELRVLAMALSQRILDNAAIERKLLAEHYFELGVVPGKRVGVVDIGYAGTMQAAIQRITGNEAVAGYYYITFETALEVEHRTGLMRGYAGDFVKREIHHDAICRNGFLFETLFCSSDASFVCFQPTTSGGRELRLDVTQNDAVRRSLVDKVHDAAVALARDIHGAFGHRIPQLALSSSTATRLLADFISSPSGRDAEIFEGCVFDDSFAGSKPRFIVPPRRAIASSSNAIKNAIWKEGAAVFSRRPDIFEAKKKIVKVVEKKTPVVKPVKAALKPSKLETRISRVESTLVQRLSTVRKYEKYLRDRRAFFVDSKGSIARVYWQTIGQHLKPSMSKA